MIRTSIFLLLFFLTGLSAHAAKRYWVAATASTWNSTANWSSSSGGAGGSSVPTSSDTAYFDGNGTGNDTLDVNVSVKRLEIAAGYTGTIVQGTYTVTIGTTGAVLSGGTFAGGSGSITASGAFTISGCAFTSTSGTLTLSGNYTLSSGSFTHNSGKVTFSTSCTITGTTDFYQLSFAPAVSSATFTIASGTNLVVNDDFSYEGSQFIQINGDTIKAKADIYLSNTNTGSNSGTATLQINGSGNQTMYGNSTAKNSIPVRIYITKSATDTLFLVSTISIRKGWNLSSGVVSAGTSTLYVTDAANTITGSQAFYNLTFDAVVGTSSTTIASSTVLTVTNTLSITGTQAISLLTGDIHAKANIIATNTNTSSGGDATITINGTGSQTLTGASSGQARLPHVVINKASGTLTFTNEITVTGNWTHTAGTLSTSGSTVCFWNTKTITGSDTLTNVTFNGSSAATFTIASGTTMSINGTLTLAGSNQVTINTGTINAKGNIVLSNTYNNNTAGGTASLVINGTGSQAITGNSTKGNSRLPNVTINKSSGTLSLSDVISVNGNWTFTLGTISPGTSTVHFVGNKTISGTHTLNTVSFGGSSNFTYIISTGTTLTALGSLETAGASTITIDTGTINVQGNITLNNTGTSGGGSATIVVNGTGSQSITGSGTAGQGSLPNITVDKASGTLTMNSVISVTGNWIYTQGTVDATTSSVAFYGTFNLDGQGTSATMSFYRVGISGNTRTLTGNLDVDDNLTISSGAILVGGTYTLTVGGNWNSQGTWTYNTSTVVIDGGGDNQVSGASGLAVDFYNLTFNQRSGYTTFSRAVTINHNMTLTKGRIITTSTNVLSFIDSATCTTAGDSAYVHGPVRKTGDDAFTFPLGDTALHDSIAYHPLAMTAPGVNTDQFEAYYNAAPHTVGDSLVDSLAGVSQVEYWSLERKTGTSAVTTTLGWNKNSTSIADLNTLRVGNWNGTKWLDLGAASITTNGYTGTITASVAPSYSVGNITILAPALSKSNPPYALLKKKLDGGYYQAPNGRLYFRFDEEYNDVGGTLRFNIYSDLNVLVTSDALTTVTPLWPVEYGDNRYRMNTLDCDFSPSGALTNGFYILEVINDKNERWYLRFKQTTSVTVTNCYSSPNAQ